HGLLARVRDVQTVEAHALGAFQQFGQRGGRELQRFEIDTAVHRVETEFAAFLLMHRGRKRAADARADQSAEEPMRGCARAQRVRFHRARSAHFATFFASTVAMRSSASTYPCVPQPTMMASAMGDTNEWCRNASRLCTFEIWTSITGLAMAESASAIAT